MKTSTKYELKSKTKGFGWKTFDTYKDRNDPAIEKYTKALKGMRFNDGVKLVTITTTKTEESL